MAVWQFCFFIIPGKNAGYSKAEDVDEIISWKNAPAVEPYVDFLEKSESWSNSIVQYGNVDSTCIEFIMENGRSEEISCRLDLRTLTGSLLNEILAYIERIDGAVYCENRIYAPNTENMKELILGSNAGRFCEDPKAFLSEIKL